jgi:hypothetical protein
LSKNVKIKIYKTIILAVVLYGCETLSLTLREEPQTVNIPEEGVEVMDRKGMTQQEIGENCIMRRNFLICTLHQIPLE